MRQDETQSIINSAKIHEQRLREAVSAVKDLFPMDANKIQSLTQNQFFAIDTLTNRFAKLQDLMGARLFDLCLNTLGENTDGMSMIDKANKLEKLHLIDDAHTWTDLRKIRNNLTHEYPDQPEVAAEILNKVYGHVDSLIEIHKKVTSKIGQA